MEEFRRCHVPAFGSWNSSDDVEFSQCFDGARQVGLFPYDYYGGGRDLYFAGDLYGYDMVAPAVIVVPRRRRKSRTSNASEAKKKGVKEQHFSPVSTLSPLFSPLPVKKACKPVDEDLYRISPDLLRAVPKRKKGWGIFSSCLMSNCAA